MDVKNLASLARLELVPCEQARVQREISEFEELVAVLDGFCQVDSLDCNKSSEKQLLRDDTVIKYDSNKILDVAVGLHGNYITVPLTVKEKVDDK